MSAALLKVFRARLSYNLLQKTKIKYICAIPIDIILGM